MIFYYNFIILFDILDMVYLFLIMIPFGIKIGIIWYVRFIQKLRYV